ncbi:hypothetical protein P9112_005870 [Eukaryota sp. TZLM1-RC]
MLNRFVEHFVHVGLSSSSTQLPSSRFRPDHSYSPSILSQYSVSDVPPLPPHIEKSLLPQGVNVIPSSETRSPPTQFFTITITDISGNRRHASILQFTELIPPHRLPPGSTSRHVTKATSALVLLTSHKQFGPIHSSLTALLSAVRSGTSTSDIVQAVVFLTKIPLPSAGKAVQFDFLSTSIALVTPPINSFPLLDVNIATVFERLSIENVITVFTSITAEQSVIFISSNAPLLSTVIEFFIAILYPFKFLHSLCEILNAETVESFALHNPIPYIFGVLNGTAGNRTRDLGDVTELDPNLYKREAICVYLDSDVIKFGKGNQSQLNLPDKLYSKLWKSLKQCDLDYLYLPKASKVRSNFRSDLYDQRTSMLPLLGRPTPNTEFEGIFEAKLLGELNLNMFVIKHDCRFDATKIRKSFLRVFTSIFQNLRQFIQPKSSANLRLTQIFNKDSFVTSFPESSRAWIKGLVDSAGFWTFLENRLSPPCFSFELLFFEEQLIAKINRSAFSISKKPTPFLDKSDLNLNCVYFLPPLNTYSASFQSNFTRTNTFPDLKFSKVEIFGAHVSNDFDLFVSKNSFELTSSPDDNHLFPKISLVEKELTVTENPVDAVFDYEPLQVFIRSCLVSLRFKRLKSSVFVLQKLFKGYLQRKSLLKSLDSVDDIQSIIRSKLHVMRWSQLRLSTIKLQSIIRMNVAKNRYKLMKSNSIKLQSIIKGFLSRRSFYRTLHSSINLIIFKIISIWTMINTPLSVRCHFIKFSFSFSHDPLFFLSALKYELYKLSLLIGDLPTCQVLTWWITSTKPVPFYNYNEFKKVKKKNSKLYNKEIKSMIKELSSWPPEKRVLLYNLVDVHPRSKNRKREAINRLLGQSPKVKDCPRYFLVEADMVGVLLGQQLSCHATS